MLIQFTPKQIAEKWSEIWPVVREGLPLAYMSKGDGIGILGGLLNGQLHALGVIEEGVTPGVDGASAILLTAVQGDPFARIPILYVYSYGERRPLSEQAAGEVAGELMSSLAKFNAQCIVCPQDLGSLGKAMPVGKEFKWTIYDKKE